MNNESNRAPAAPASPPSHWDEWAMQKARAFVRRTEEVNHPRSMLVSAIHCALVEAMEFANRAAPVPASTGREPEAWAVIDGDGKILETSVHKWAVESWLKYDDARKLVPLYGNLLAARELDADAERRAFEAQAALDDYRPLRRNSEAGNYTSAVVEACWSIWQAARATAESAPASAAPDLQWISVEDRLPTNTCLAVYQPHFHGHKPQVIRAVHFKQYQIKASGEDGESTEYNEADDTDYIKAGWYERIDNWGDFSSVAVCEGEVTHWMPLPATPSNSPVGAKEQE